MVNHGVGGADEQDKAFDISKRVVWEAYERVKANKGAPGVDDESIEQFEQDLKGNLYKLWNRLSSGSYFPPPVKLVEIPKAGGVRPLGVPTVADRVAQTVVCRYLEPLVEPAFHPDSYGYRPGRSALDAVAVCRERCWRSDWVVDLDIKSFLEGSSHCSFADCQASKRRSWAAGGSIRRPFRRPVRTWTARSWPRLTRCNSVWRDTP